MSGLSGWAEVAAYHVDRILEINRKPPVVGRVFTNHYFYSFNDTYAARRHCDRRGESLFLLSESACTFSDIGRLWRNAETYDVPVALVPWVDELEHYDPRWTNYGRVLTAEQRIPRHWSRGNGTEPEDHHLPMLRLLSDTILFDYLVDGMFLLAPCVSRDCGRALPFVSIACVLFEA